MMRHSSICCLLFISLISFTVLCSSTKPNIIVLFADDMGYNDAGFTGHPTIRTPNLDRMAAEGMKFNQFYSGSAICSPSRGALLTGRLPPRCGIYTQSKFPEDDIFRVFFPTSTGGLPESEITIASALRQVGYKSKLVGKWHLGHHNALPTLRGFDEFYGLPYSQDEGCPPGVGMNCTHEWQHIWSGTPLYRNTTIIEQPVNLQTLVPRYTNEATSFIEANANASNPFFLYMAYDEVHVPLFASKEFEGKSLRGLFGDAVMEMDNSIGNIINKLKELRIENNTIVFFTSDNGPWKDQELDGGSSIFRGEKGTTWEGGFREPAFVWWPTKIAPFQVNMDIASTMDIFSTSLDVAGATIPTDRIIDGVSLLPTLLHNQPIPRKCYFFYRQSVLQAARCGSYKAHYITRCGFCGKRGVHHNPPLLFNVDQDPFEQYELDTTKYAAQLNEINEAVSELKSNMKLGEPQLNPQSYEVQPCCNHATKCVCQSDEMML